MYDGKNVRDALGIRVMPLSIMIDGTVYPDDDQLDGERFMEMMAKAKICPKQANHQLENSSRCMMS